MSEQENPTPIIQVVDTNKDYLTIEEAAVLMCCSRSRFNEVKKVVGFKQGGVGKKCYRRREIVAYMERTFGE